MAVSLDTRPILRPVDIRQIQQRGQAAFLLRDPMQLSSHAVVVPHYLSPVLMLCDGTRDIAAICVELADSYGLMLTPPVVGEVLNALDEALLLDNRRFADARAAAIAAFRAAPFRPLSHAGAVYPANAGALESLLDGYIREGMQDVASQSGGVGVFSPHIDYARGGLVYGAVWGQCAELAADAETIVLLATDHAGGESLVTLTNQSYATPFGVLPTDREVVAALAEAVGHEVAFADELHHQREHSIELVAVWLHHMRRGRPCRLVPILCGSFAPFVRGEVDLATDPTIASLIRTLREVVALPGVVVVASGDLSHVGPAFGGEPQHQADWATIGRFDAALIDRLCAGDADGFFGHIQRVGDQTNVCGVSPFYLSLKALGEPCGGLAAYDQCAADDQRTSLVSVCGIRYYKR